MANEGWVCGRQRVEKTAAAQLMQTSSGAEFIFEQTLALLQQSLLHAGW